jgi:hypothetical protein
MKNYAMKINATILGLIPINPNCSRFHKKRAKHMSGRTRAKKRGKPLSTWCARSHFKTFRKVRRAQAIWKKPAEVVSNRS